MSQPKRYSIRGFSAAMVEEDNGVMVKWEDYAALQAEVERLKAETVKQIEAALPPVEAYIAKLEAENERLRKAGDDIERDFYQQWYLDTYENLEAFESIPSIKAWLAAKGVQP